MNIQPSVILWTIICFLLLMVILKNFLFHPVLRVLDERRDKLEKAREKKAANARLLQEQQQMMEKMQADYERKRKEETQAALEQILAEEKKLLKDAHRDCLQHIDIYRDQREKELEEILAAVGPKVAQAADLFVKRIVFR